MTGTLPRVGATLLGPGKRLTFTRATPAALTFEEVVAPDAPPVPPHLHLRQAERFTVLDGTLDVTAGGVRRRLGPGDTILVPAGVAHTYANGDPMAPLRVEVTLDPPLAAHRFFESVYGLGRDGHLPPQGLRDALALAALSHEHGFYLAAVPLALQRPLMALGAGLAALAGVRPWRGAYGAEPPAADHLRVPLFL
jgi:mannose-6-phosphate isomerase-like protein (cupin superfamily)